MISRHIKKHGPVNFTNSQFVVTSRANNNLSQTGEYSTIKTPEKPNGQEDKSPANKQLINIENQEQAKTQKKKKTQSKSNGRAGTNIKSMNI